MGNTKQNQWSLSFAKLRDDYAPSYVIRDDDRNIVAEVPCDNSKAANLIVAAPDLIDLLDEIMEDMNSVVDNCESWSIEDLKEHAFWVQDKAFKAVAKAKGESNE